MAIEATTEVEPEGKADETAHEQLSQHLSKARRAARQAIELLAQNIENFYSEEYEQFVETSRHHYEIAGNLRESGHAIEQL